MTYARRRYRWVMGFGHTDGDSFYLYQHSETRNPQQVAHARIAKSVVCSSRHRLHVRLRPARCGCTHGDLHPVEETG